jgi:protein Hikeshi
MLPFSSSKRLSNDKPSAIFRLRGTYTPSTTSSTAQVAFSGPSANDNSDVTAILGIAIEPLDQIAIALSSNPSISIAPAPPAVAIDPTIIAERIVKNLFNYISSFVDSKMVAQPSTMVPMGLVHNWYENLLTKIRAGGARFLERDE